LQDDYHTIKNLLDYFQIPPQLIDNIYNQELELFEDDQNHYLYLEHTFLVYNPAIPGRAQIQSSIILGANFLIL
jgi:hypothetical protein